MKPLIKIILLLSGFVIYTDSLKAQEIIRFDTIQPPREYENVAAKKIFSDNDVTTFVIWVKKQVPLHIFETHTEQVYILKGKGIFTLGSNTFPVKKGDFLIIPIGTPHSVEVLSKKPMKVISVQAPEFLGDDRIMIDQD